MRRVKASSKLDTNMCLIRLTLDKVQVYPTPSFWVVGSGTEPDARTRRGLRPVESQQQLEAIKCQTLMILIACGRLV